MWGGAAGKGLLPTRFVRHRALFQVRLPGCAPARRTLLKVDGIRLHVIDLDAAVGTKIYDLSPYFTEMGRGILPTSPRGPARCWLTTGQTRCDRIVVCC